jgi:hypothetical protein
MDTQGMCTVHSYCIGKKEKTVNFKPYVFLGTDHLVATKGALTALMYNV